MCVVVNGQWLWQATLCIMTMTMMKSTGADEASIRAAMDAMMSEWFDPDVPKAAFLPREEFFFNEVLYHRYAPFWNNTNNSKSEKIALASEV